MEVKVSIYYASLIRNTQRKAAIFTVAATPGVAGISETEHNEFSETFSPCRAGMFFSVRCSLHCVLCLCVRARVAYDYGVTTFRDMPFFLISRALY